MSLVSVIIPCYNQGEFVCDSVNSVLNQVYQNFEIIIVDDGSDDESTVIKLNNLNHKKIKVIHSENQGLSAARNRGFIEATGEYIQFLDADDIISPLKFEAQLDVFDQHQDTDVCYTNFRIYDIEKQSFVDIQDKMFLSEDPFMDFLFKWERGLSIPIHCAMFRKNLWESDLPFNEDLRSREDWLMWCSLAVREVKFYFLDKEYAIYRHHKNNMSKNTVEMNYSIFLAAYYIMQIIPEYLKKEFLKKTIEHINRIQQLQFFPTLVNEVEDLKARFNEMDKTIDFKIGHSLLKPYRFLKTKLLGRKYLYK